MTGRTFLLASAALLAAAPALAQQQRLYVSNEDTGTVSVIDMATAAVTESFEVGVRPRGIRLSPDGKTLFVALSGSPKCGPNVSEEECEKMAADKTKDGVAMIDVAAGGHKLVRVLPGGSDPEQFDVAPDGKRLYVANEDAGRISVVEVETGRIVKEVKVGEEPEGVMVSPDGAYVLTTSEETSTIAAIDTAKLEVTCTLTVGKRPRDIAFVSPTVAFVSSEASGQVFQLDPVACKTTRAFKLPDGARPMGLALSADKSTLFVGNGRARTVSAIEVATGTVRTSEPVGVRPWGIVLSPDGTRLFTANGPSNDVAVLDAKTLAVQSKIAVGKSPWGLAAPER